MPARSSKKRKLCEAAPKSSKKRIKNENWSAARVRAYEALESNPNTYYYRFNTEGQKCKKGAFSENEVKLFMSLLKKFGAGSWGIFSMNVPGRVGYTCSQFYRKLLNWGWIWDSNYVVSDGKIVNLRATNLSPEKRASLQKYGFIVIYDPSDAWGPLPACHPKAPDEVARMRDHFIFHERTKLEPRHGNGVFCPILMTRSAYINVNINVCMDKFPEGTTFASEHVTVGEVRKQLNQKRRKKFQEETMPKKKKKKKSSETKGKSKALDTKRKEKALYTGIQYAISNAPPLNLEVGEKKILTNLEVKNGEVEVTTSGWTIKIGATSLSANGCDIFNEWKEKEGPQFLKKLKSLRKASILRFQNHPNKQTFQALLFAHHVMNLPKKR